MKIIKFNIILTGIIFLAIFLRFYQLGQNPPSLTWDEVAWGYNAYSLGIDGKDEFGRLLPVNYLESFGDFKPPVYAYLDVIPVKLFGLNEFAVRFPSALFGVLTVFMTYFLVLRIFPKSTSLAIFSAFLLAISPWHINLSRAAFEANVASFFLIIGVWAFLAAVGGRKWFLIVSAVSFALSIYTFNTARIVAPLLAIALAVAFRDKLLVQKRETVLACIVGLLLLFPTLPFLLSPQASLRFKEVNIFSDISIVARANQQIENDNNAWWSKILHNRRFSYGVEYMRHYFDHFTPSFLFIKGDGNPKFSTQDIGQLYLWEFPFFAAGILFLFRRRVGHWWIVPLWLLVGIIPAATARETPHALRIETTLPTFQIFTALGIVTFLAWIKNTSAKRMVIPALIFIFSLLFLNFLYYFHGYYAHYPREYSGEWQYGYKDAISYVKSVEDRYDQINVTTDLGRPYAYFLFYTATSPNVFRETMYAQREVFGFVNVSGFLQYRFTKNAQDLYEENKKALFVDVADRVPQNAKIQKTFHLLNGSSVLVAYTL